jgi:hypothetical protein
MHPPDGIKKRTQKGALHWRSCDLKSSLDSTEWTWLVQKTKTGLCVINAQTLGYDYLLLPHVRWRKFLTWNDQIEPVSLGWAPLVSITLLDVMSHLLTSAIRFPNSTLSPHLPVCSADYRGFNC